MRWKGIVRIPPATHLCLKPAQTKQTDQQNTPAFNRNIAGGLVKGRGGFPSETPWYLLVFNPAINGCRHFLRARGP